jgi:hypothetical protein
LTTYKGIALHKNALRRDDSESSFCYGVSSSLELPLGTNFLATQLWPSARVAATCIQLHGIASWRMCELGCGPGLPSLTFAKKVRESETLKDSALSEPRIFATDLDSFALGLVDQAASDQGLDDLIVTSKFDLVEDNFPSLPSADLYVMADVFETNLVARQAAQLTADIIIHDPRKHVWTFAQTDRAQRQVYSDELKRLLQDTSLEWDAEKEGPKGQLWLCDVDETKVLYG